MVCAFLNRVFEPVLNTAHVDHVDISWLEEAWASRTNGGSYRQARHASRTWPAWRASWRLVLVEARRKDARRLLPGRARSRLCGRWPRPFGRSACAANAHRLRRSHDRRRQVPAYVDKPGVDPNTPDRDLRVPERVTRTARWDDVPSRWARQASSETEPGIADPCRSATYRSFSGGRAEAAAECSLSSGALACASPRRSTVRRGAAENRELEVRSTPRGSPPTRT